MAAMTSDEFFRRMKLEQPEIFARLPATKAMSKKYDIPEAKTDTVHLNDFLHQHMASRVAPYDTYEVRAHGLEEDMLSRAAAKTVATVDSVANTLLSELHVQ